ncbi:MAG: hypothetical protein H6625_05245 [Bdellovibrionaceae bacterium]|nr:hypothetical protein [Pseudobdellovibrionaceae bacterium]
MLSSIKSTILIISISSLIGACSEQKSPTKDIDLAVSPEFKGPPEPEYCKTATSYTSSVTISGTAKFVVRKAFFTGGGGLSAADTANPKPIRYAEIRVLNSGGTAIQCAETDGSGNFSFVLPKGSDSFTIHIMARAENSKVKVSVLNSPESNTIYSLSKSVPASTNQVLTLTAQATGDILGGAFNIYDQILNVNEYIRQQLSSNFVATKVQAYWKPGFNPGDYVESGPVSFYYPGFDRLFILGGVNGDTDYTDTDHFDNSIIVHEYGHFLEDNYSVSNSPGGAHYGNGQIDARLAWSEGFANFLNAAVRTYISGSSTDANYVDTFGNSSGSTRLGIFVDVESYEGCVVCDRPSENGEGHFREFAITRFLYDAIDDTADEIDKLGNWNATTNNPSLADGTGREGDSYIVTVAGTNDLGSGSQTFSVGDYIYYNGTTWIKDADGSGGTKFDNISGMFPEIWSALISGSGFKSSKTNFRDIGLLNFVETVAGGTSWTKLRVFHGMNDDTSNNRELRREYAYYIDTISNGADNCSGQNFTIYPKSESKDYTESNLFRNNDFFYLQHPGGNLSITLKYKTASGTEANLDLYIYDDKGPFGFANGVVGYSTSFPNGTSGDTETVTVNAGTQAAGDYLINVYALGGIGSTTNFELISGSKKLCPKNISL